MQKRIDFVAENVIKFINKMKSHFKDVTFDLIFWGNSIGSHLTLQIGEHYRKSDAGLIKYICGKN